MSMRARVSLLLAACCCAALALAGPAGARAKPYPAYGWPVRPFDRPHPIRGNFGDPRTAFLEAFGDQGFEGGGAFSFHNGVDIAVPDGTDVYPVVSGRVRKVSGDFVSVVTQDSRTFRYEHIVAVVVRGEHVDARRTVLGYVRAGYAHVHLTEFDGTRVVNPLAPGHLTPYDDAKPPHVGGIELRRGTTLAALDPHALCGRVSFAAEAFDLPSLPVPGSFAGLPVTPARVRWQLQQANGRVVLPLATAADFKTTLPLPNRFWNVYARGTYQNAPRFGGLHYNGMPGRYLFSLAWDLDTRELPNGDYLLTVVAADVRGHTGRAALPLTVENVAGTETGCPPAPAPEPR